MFIVISVWLPTQVLLLYNDNCLLWGTRVIIPQQAHKLLLDELHVGHPGIEWIKRLTRNYLWWPGLDTEIEARVKSCVVCQSNRKIPASAPLHPWEWPHMPWSRVHIDYAGPFLGRMFLLIVDSHSKLLAQHLQLLLLQVTNYFCNIWIARGPSFRQRISFLQ